MLSGRLLAQVMCLNNRLTLSSFRLLVPQISASTALRICTSSWNSARLMLDTENKLAHDILKASTKAYQVFRVELNDGEHYPTQLPTIVHNPPSADAAVIDDVFRGFCAVLRYCDQPDSKVCFSDDEFLPFTELFCSVAHKFNNEQLLETLRLLANKPATTWMKAPNYIEVWNTLDVVCTCRVDELSIDQLLMFCDAWYTLQLGRIGEFVAKALYRLSRKVKRMKPEHLVHTMFFCNLVRKPLLDMFDFEVNMDRSIDKMSLSEIGVMAMGFFKTKTKISSQVLIDKIYQRLMAELNTVQDITLVSLLKTLRYSSGITQANNMMQLLDGLCPQIERLSLFGCLHIALLGSDIHCCHEPSFELILQRFNHDLEQARLKDMERLCLVMSIFNYQSPNGTEHTLSANILKQLNSKVDEIASYPRCFPTCLHFLSVKGYYDAEMISSVLEKRFLELTYSKSRLMGREIFHLDSFVKINLKMENYSGNQLPESARRTFGKFLTHHMPERNSKYRLSFTDSILLEVKETTDRLFQITTFKHILPHYERPDVVLCYNKNELKAIDISPKCAENYIGTILTRTELLGDNESDDIDTIAIVVVGWNNVVRDTYRHTGLLDMKLQQLKLLGHKHVVIYWHEWRALSTTEQRESLIKQRLATVTNI